MANIKSNYISKVLVNTTVKNDDVVTIDTKYLSPQGDVFELRKELIEPSVIQTDVSLKQLQPEVSTTYPYKIVVPIDPIDSASILRSPTLSTASMVTASQNYYTPVYFERYKPEILNALDKGFFELTVNSVTVESDGE